jgi:hypothetical protein
MSGRSLNVRVDLLNELPLPVAFDEWGGERGHLWFRCERDDMLNLGRSLFGSYPGNEGEFPAWIEKIILCARDDFRKAISKVLLGDGLVAASRVSSEAMPRSIFQSGSGAVQIVCPESGLYVVADMDIWKNRSLVLAGASSRALPPLSALEGALIRKTATLEVVLGGVQVELSMLLNLCCGDVLRLPNRLDDSLTVLCEGVPLARAHLGEVRGQVGVQLVSPKAGSMRYEA